MTTTTARLRPTDLGKPRMRGWLHAYAFFVAIAAGIVLCVIAGVVSDRPEPTTVLACALYSITVCGLFGISALYHRRVWTESGRQVMRRLDHTMIFVLIAGTYTPFAVLLLGHTKAIVILSLMWGG